MTRRVAFVGPLPPPVHGFSNVCAHVLDLLSVISAVEIFDRTPRSNHVVLRRLGQLLQPFRYVAWSLKGRNCSLYLALSGGYGQFFDWLYVIAARAFGSRIFIHHHSFAYLNSPSLLNRIFFALVRRETHIVLSRGMGLALANMYKLGPNFIKVVSNAALYAPKKKNGGFEVSSCSPICLGFLSNVTFEKGFVEFFEVLSRLKKRGVAYKGIIAGPVDPAAAARFAQLLASSSDIEYLGAIYGDAKDQFYDRLDFFLFPTQYANEAEPLVIHEALRSGVQVIACDRGAIAEMLGNGAGLIFPRNTFVQSAAIHIEGLSRNRAELKFARQRSSEEFQRVCGIAHDAMAELLNEISGVTTS
jgi:glycosyltransferase involved in cell wall biosynthesis